MVSKRIVGTEKDTSRLLRKSQARRGEAIGGGAPDLGGRIAYLSILAAALLKSAAACAKDAQVEAVHRFRTGSRRVQALVESIVRDAGETGTLLDGPARSWLRQLKKLRRAAGPVRDLDVHIRLLKAWMQKMVPEAASSDSQSNGTASQSGGPVSMQAAISALSTLRFSQDNDALRAQAVTLCERLEDRRKALGAELEREVEKRLKKLERHGQAFCVAARQMPEADAAPSAGLLALSRFVRAAESMPELDATNLHEFRKAVKKARYVAEVGGEESVAAGVAKSLKRVQDSIGEWHDWQCLTAEAKSALDEQRGEQGWRIAAFFQSEAEDRFLEAMRIAHFVRAQLTEEWSAKNLGPYRKPPASIALKDRRRSAASGGAHRG